jgi:hypothetical protein
MDFLFSFGSTVVAKQQSCILLCFEYLKLACLSLTLSFLLGVHMHLALPHTRISSNQIKVSDFKNERIISWALNCEFWSFCLNMKSFVSTFFFSNSAGELRVISLRQKKGTQIQETQHTHPTTHRSKRPYTQEFTHPLTGPWITWSTHKEHRKRPKASKP